ncbi:MAG: LysM peptidoglycan-binding domain-containing protein [Ferruginibacter sp.]
MKNLIVLLFFIPLFAHAQTTHTVAPKETLYSLARQYNIPPKDLAAYNNIPVTTGLTIGQLIKIPASGRTKPTVKETAPLKPPVENRQANVVETGSVPIYHKVEKKETLYRISKLNPNVTVDDLKKWNNLSGDAVAEGTNLIVAYQKGKKSAPIVSTTIKDAKENEPAAVEPQKQAPPKMIIPDKAVVVTETRPVPVKTMEPIQRETNKVTGRSFNGGYFKSLYTEQTANKNVKEESGTAGIFKSTSGWEDGKYYCLHNNAPAGSIVKITNKHTQKSVYAKVLDVIPDLKQNNGIMVRLSNAAADELGAGEANFESVINY